jgi:hypothetical protein
LFQNKLDLDRSLLKMIGVTPLSPLVGEVPDMVVVAFTDMMMSGILVGGSVIIGPKEAVTVLIDTVGVLMAGEFGL